MTPPPSTAPSMLGAVFFAKNDGMGSTAFSLQDRSWTGFSSLAPSIV